MGLGGSEGWDAWVGCCCRCCCCCCCCTGCWWWWGGVCRAGCGLRGALEAELHGRERRERGRDLTEPVGVWCREQRNCTMRGGGGCPEGDPTGRDPTEPVG